MSLEAWGDELPDEGIFDAAINAGWIDPDDLSQAAKDVLAERERQELVEGFKPEQDAAYQSGDLAMAAATYALNATSQHPFALQSWPWARSWWKPTTPRRDLVKAGALILAEIERLDSLAKAAGRAE